MSRTKALALGALTLWPVVYILLFMGTLAYMALFTPNRPMPPYLALLFVLHLLTMLEIFVLLVYYIAHLFKTTAIPQDKKALWGVVLFMGNVLSMPVYWYLYIWTPPAEET